ncbi:hypothetical protein [Butyribacter intestini]|jgi:hypothetical protein|uniref:Uncharacterized protein n=1 Tax=Butyribacter intestini TaxID=1703332 RepID=A0AAW3JTI1_9FIRM|nr:hypothetical protein APZ18_12350 [Butyribacter intestini]RHU74749.1 hypothetical protein DXC30_12545 [Butyribacter intestini]
MMDKKVKEITELQKELDRRTAVEKLAEKLIIDGKFEEAKELLDTLDDDKARELMEEEPEHEFSKNDEQTLIEYIAGAGKSCSKEEEIKRAETLGRLFAVLRQPEDLYALRFALSNLISSIQVGSSFQLVVNYDKDLKKLKINYSHKPENFLK